MKLKESIPSNSVKIIELYNKIDSESLDTSPDFQRKLVWKKQHKYAFIETILMNFPFPEVYIASSEMDVKTKKVKEIVVDGKQRLTAIVEYIKGINDFENQKKIKPFDDLEEIEKKDFLNYLVTVKDLKDMDYGIISEVFQRINSTEYSLNANERLNALFGDGEFTVFCKQIVDKDFSLSIDESDVILDASVKEKLNLFFIENKIFSDNDISRMFDVHYIMLIVATLLEGDYFSRSLKVNPYLEKYNADFSIYESPLTCILNSVYIINTLKLSQGSYWYNKANLFTLIIELANIPIASLDLQKFEIELLNLETKVDLYFSDDESINISEDEKKYFEFARQGSHEKAARIHRGKVIRDILNRSMVSNVINELPIKELNINILKEKNASFSILIPTDTGLSKNIMDATSTVRDFLIINELHDYSTQKFGPDNKVIISGQFINENNEIIPTQVSLYRSNGRGDFRIWFSDLKNFANANDELALLVHNGKLTALNISKNNYSELLTSL